MDRGVLRTPEVKQGGEQESMRSSGIEGNLSDIHYLLLHKWSNTLIRLSPK